MGKQSKEGVKKILIGLEPSLIALVEHEMEIEIGKLEAEAQAKLAEKQAKRPNHTYKEPKVTFARTDTFRLLLLEAIAARQFARGATIEAPAQDESQADESPAQAS